jgi:hypothetical protein
MGETIESYRRNLGDTKGSYEEYARILRGVWERPKDTGRSMGDI